jgi:hypothetical protein
MTLASFVAYLERDPLFSIRKMYGVMASLSLILLVVNVMPALVSDGTSQCFPTTERDSLRIIANDSHGPIAIDGDANFSATALAEDWSGDGSAQDPYIIENYDRFVDVV